MRKTGEHLFVYGTLLLPKIMQQVSQQRHFSRKAILYNFARYKVRGKRYPGIVREHGASVTGLLYSNVTPAAWRRLDDYEGHFYQRQQVEVELGQNEYCLAWVYLVPVSQRHRLGWRDWSFAQFRQRHLQGFLQHLLSRRHA